MIDRLRDAVEETLRDLDTLLNRPARPIEAEEVGTVIFVGEGIARVNGLAGARLEELVRFPGNSLGMVFNLDPDEVGVVLLDRSERFRVGTRVRGTGRVLDVPVGEALLGRVVDALGRPLDGRGPVRSVERRPIERPAASIMDRAGVDVPLATGIKAVDALVPIGRGQRELILGDRQTGKTAIALDTILNQRDTGVLCVYCAIGQRGASTAKLIEDLRRRGAMSYCTVMVASGDDPPGLQFACPYAAMTAAEFFMETGRDVLIVFDDLTRHAQAYRELSLLLRRPPGREAYPGDVFYIHSRLLERATRLRPELGGGSVTALPIVETEAQNLSAYIPTNIISITDGQIYLSPVLFQKGHLPAVDVGRSVSRVGGRAQLPAYRAVTGALRLSYAQFEELEAFARFGTRLDEETRRTLEHGRRVRETLKQPRYQPLPPSSQVAVLLVVTSGLVDHLPPEKVTEVEAALCRNIVETLPGLCRRVDAGEPLRDDDRRAILEAAARVIAEMGGGP